VPEFNGGKKKGAHTKQAADKNTGKRVFLTNNKLQLSCHMNTISMGELGEIGWYLKLETVQDKNRFMN